MRRSRFGVPFIAALACILSVARAAEEDHPVEDAARHKLQGKTDPSLPTLFLVGDSTMKNGTPGQRGWGEEMAQFFDPHAINVVNQAIGGRSSRTFQSEGRWDGVVAMLKKGDYVIIQFGHNDPGPVNDNLRARGSIKGTGEETQEIDNLLTHKHEVVHSYGWYMRKYVADVKAAGATPIVFSLVPRNSWKDGKVVRSSGNNYGGWSQQISQATETTFVDHNEIIAEGLDALGQEKAAALFADGKLHTTAAGAVLNARFAVSGLKALPGDPFEKYLSPAGREVEAFKPAATTSPTTHATLAPMRLVIIGDSTVCEYPQTRPERGWGQFIQERFDNVAVINLAASGRSTKTFIEEGLWKKALEQKPDYVLIQFGHNDSHGPDKPESTDAATTYKDYLRRYIDDSRAIGATPILVTPMVRRTFDAAGQLIDALAPYADAMKDVAKDKKVPVIDLHASTKALVEKLGPDASAEMANKTGDATHFNEKGARAMAELVLKDLPLAEPKLKEYLKRP
jgi:rhamnogalacturonan acetylesterase